MKNKSKKRLLLNLSGALTAVAIPAITVISCSKDESKETARKQTINNTTKKNITTNSATINSPKSTNINTNTVNGSKQFPQQLTNIKTKSDSQEIKDELLKILDNFTISVSSDFESNTLKSNDLGIIENNNFIYSYAHNQIKTNKIFDVHVSVSKKNSLAKKQTKTIKVKIVNLNQGKPSFQSNQNQNVISEPELSIKNLNFNSSFSWVNIQNGSIRKVSSVKETGSYISIDTDEAIINDFTYENFKKLFSSKNGNNLEFELEYLKYTPKPGGKYFKTTLESVDDFKLLSNNNKYLEFKLQIYEKSKKDNKKQWLRSIMIHFADKTKPTLTLDKNRQNISFLGKIEDKGFWDLNPEYHLGNLFIPVGWDNQNKTLIEWIKEQFVLTDINQSTGSNSPKLLVEWAFQTNKITHFNRTAPPALLTIVGRDADKNGLKRNEADFKMYLKVFVVKADKPLSIIKNYQTRHMRKYNPVNINGIDVVSVNKSDIELNGWESVYDEIKKIYKVWDENSYDNFSNKELAKLKFPLIENPIISSAKELDIQIKIDGVLTAIKDSENIKNIKVKIIDNTVN